METIVYNPVFWIFLSYAVGQIIADYLLHKRKVDWFEDRNYISDELTKTLGILAFCWLIKNSFMGWFSKNMKLKASAGIEELNILKNHMTGSEAGHLVAFYFLLIVNIIFIFLGLKWWYIALFLLINIVFNLYLVFLQQYNKRRISKLLNNIIGHG
ncbi:MAG: hypothetical protein AAGA77_00060 [Bacteroidota bacterium]